MGVERNGRETIEILMITSRRTKSTNILPKGGWEQDETLEAAATRETLEEAGVRGELKGSKLGPYNFESQRSGPCKAYMYIMKVEEELDDWPEQPERQRLWCTVDQAIESCKWEWMKEALQAFK